jgi:branched-chain amino acid transport system substrate-binding protein
VTINQGSKLMRSRTKMGTWTIGLAAALLALGAGAPQAQDAETVKVAVIAPLSGPWARQGQLIKLGAEMAVDEINDLGGIAALGGAKLELLSADAGDTPEKAKNAAQRLISQEPDLVGGTGAWLSSFTLAVTEVTERAHIPWLTLSYADSLTERGFDYIFQTSLPASQQSAQALPTILELAKQATGGIPKTAGIIGDNTASPGARVCPSPRPNRFRPCDWVPRGWSGERGVATGPRSGDHASQPGARCRTARCESDAQAD